MPKEKTKPNYLVEYFYPLSGGSAEDLAKKFNEGFRIKSVVQGCLILIRRIPGEKEILQKEYLTK